ncbi:MAG: DUF115 domain-containing protein [Candidatus Omnitrophica bacterium]|nr:DUF115 domain-containing protein [Candidatus Omnitrophota bacterium]
MRNVYCVVPIREQIRYRIRTYWHLFRYYKNFMWPHRELLKKTANLRGIHKGQNAFVFGCGPSLKRLDIQKIKQYQKKEKFNIYAVNAFINSEFCQEVIPDYYILSDPQSFKPEKEYSATASLVWKKLNQYHVPLFVPADLYQQADYQHKFIFCDQANLYSRNVTDPLSPAGFLSLTVLKAIQIALFMGHEKIYICGVDHDHFKSLYVDEHNDLYFDDTHFYGGDKKNIYRLKGWEATMMNQFYLSCLVWESFARFRHCPIINLNPESFVDTFTKQHDLDVYR